MKSWNISQHEILCTSQYNTGVMIMKHSVLNVWTMCQTEVANYFSYEWCELFFCLFVFPEDHKFNWLKSFILLQFGNNFLMHVDYSKLKIIEQPLQQESLIFFIFLREMICLISLSKNNVCLTGTEVLKYLNDSGYPAHWTYILGHDTSTDSRSLNTHYS